ncbi:hypothetical protein OG871_14705 [Kitasatospora sp. NBC_00374]|uniref:hypothetical protein n=1 Tax=Kitasatospora sp. NBC_00374 TaxID=2975964 RepID=UPI00325268AA
MLRRKSREHRTAEPLAALVADAVRLDYGGGYARQGGVEYGAETDRRAASRPEQPRVSPAAERYLPG